MELDQFVAATRRAAESLAGLAPLMEAAIDSGLDVANRQSRLRIRHCPGCEDCAEPLPVLAGETA